MVSMSWQMRQYQEEATAHERLEAAKQRGKTNYQERMRPTSRSEIIVGLGEGRATRAGKYNLSGGQTQTNKVKTR